MRLFLFSAFISILGGCSKHASVQLEFAAQFGEQQISCTSPMPALNDLRFYVSDFRAISANGEAVALQLINDQEFQSDAVALVDLEDGEGSCRNGTTEQNSTVNLHVPADNAFSALEFTVGVPFAFNHENPLLSSPPLDDPAMHWHWRSGYKFMRAGISTEEHLAWLHLGSTGCEGQTTAITSCKRPNRVAVSLPFEQAFQHGVSVRLDQLFAELEPLEEDFDCSSGPLEQTCDDVFPKLGLGVDTPQTVFQVDTR